MSISKTPSNPSDWQDTNSEFTTNNSIEDDSGKKYLAETESTTDPSDNQPEPKETKNI